MNSGKKQTFVMSYSCGKDSTLALHKMLNQYESAALIVMINKDVNRSYFHGADQGMLKQYEEALGIPMICAPAEGRDYHLAMEEALKKAKAMGAELACFGDIDIEENRAWGEERCKNAGLKPVFPLWQKDRRQNVYELLELVYQCLIKSINNTLLPKSLLGRILDEDAVREFSKCGIDVCGENGEYHTLATDGPVFYKPLSFQVGDVLEFGDYAVIDVK